jgi:hypothetical protein
MPQLAWVAAVLSIGSLAMAAFAFLRWYRERTDRRLVSVFVSLTVSVNTALTSVNSITLTSPSRASLVLSFGVLIPLNFALLGIAFYLRRRREAKPAP